MLCFEMLRSATATGKSLNKMFNEQNSGCARELNSKAIEYWRVGALKVATQEGSNLLSSKEVTMATEPQPTSRHLSTQH